MTNKSILLISGICFLILFSCKKEELPVSAHQSGDFTTSTVNMESNYKWQIYFDLKTNSVVSKNLKTAWDLGFETGEDGYRIILNSAKAMYAFKTNNADLSSVTDTAGFFMARKFDVPSGNLDSSAIGNWKISPTVYIIDRGYNESGIHQGFRKIVFQTVDSESYSIHFSRLDGSGETTMMMPKDNNYNFTFLSFSSSTTVMIEPPKTDWDLVFTQYMESLSTTYLVTGCLLNRYNTSAKMDSIISFDHIDYTYVQNQNLSSEINTIGYNWKEFNFSSSTYIVFPKMNYLIKDAEGFYYKLHFIDFYNNSGIKGNPKFEYQQL